MASPPLPSVARVPRCRRRYAWLVLGALAAFVPMGCSQPDEITAYDAKKPDTKETPGKNRLLAAIILHDGSAWHFKLVGPMQQVTDHEAEFLAFVQSVRFNDKGNPILIPPAASDWKKEPNRQSRFAGFKIGTGTTALELTVVQIPAEKDDINLLANVNRWRLQLHRQKIDEETLAQFKRTLVVDGKDVPLLDLSGSGSGKRPRAPDEPEEIAVDPSVLKTYKPDEDWKKTDEEDPKAKALNIRREAAFKVFGESSEALVTVIPMPSSGGMKEMRGNIERWAGQVGLPPPTPEQLRDLLTGITVDDIEDCLLIDLRGPKDRSVIVVVPLADKNWIFKMTGPDKLVGAQKDKFETFVKSAKFEGGR